jgi:flagellin
MVQTAEGAIAAASDMGQRILTLATQAANSTLSTEARGAIKREMQELILSINSIGARTTYAGNALLSEDTAAAAATTAAFTMQISNSSDDSVELMGSAFLRIDGTNSTGQAFNLDEAIDDAEVDFTTAGAQSTWTDVQDDAAAYVELLDTQRSQLGAYQNRLEYTLSNITELSTNLTASRSRVVDTDYASETANLTRNQILQQAATAMLAQANQMPNVILTLLK